MSVVTDLSLVFGSDSPKTGCVKFMIERSVLMFHNKTEDALLHYFNKLKEFFMHKMIIQPLTHPVCMTRKILQTKQTIEANIYYSLLLFC